MYIEKIDNYEKKTWYKLNTIYFTAQGKLYNRLAMIF